MSSPLNVSLQAQGPPSCSSPSVDSRSKGGSSPQVNAIIKQQQRASSEQSSIPSRKSRFGKQRGRGQGGYIASSERNDIRSPTDSLTTQDQSSIDTSAQPQNNPAGFSDQTATIGNGRLGSTNNRRGGRRSDNFRGGSSGKYRQRQQTNQLIEGMEGLDIDLIESLAPSNTNDSSSSGRKERHPTNSRKVNLAHLLNYRYDRKQRGGRQRNSSYSDNFNGGSTQRANYSYYRDSNNVHKFSKQQFLQANCQFVVLDGYDYTIHKIDPDWPVEWDCIEEVKFRQIASTETTCPICLDPPIAAKITRCGHIYCWTCMLHYLSLSDENCRQCPICFEPVYKSDLRSVVSESFSNHATDEDITMKLMIRRKGCVEVESYSTDINRHLPNDCKPVYTYDDQKHYASQANLVIVDPDIVISKIAKRERDELLIKYDTDRNEPEVCFIEQALDRLNKRIERLQKLALEPSRRKDQQKLKSRDQPDLASKSYLFYQSADGQHIYLNPFSTKILCHQYSSLENCPLEIKAKILQMDWVSMSEAWRKRFKYLGHLPLTCEFRLIEIDFESSELVSVETYEAFKDQIKLRANERERRRREERKREKIIQVEQDRKIYGIQPSLKINLNSIEQFPSVSDQRYLGLTKTRNHDSDDDMSSDDNETDDNNIHTGAIETSTESSNLENDTRNPSEETVELSTNDCQDISGGSLSFLEIQRQEEAIAAKMSSRTGESKPGKSAWEKSSASSSSHTQSSSFAQKLVDAKSNQKGWTRNVTQHQATVSAGPSTYNRTSTSVDSNRYSQAELLDDGGEELRAPPCDFTISDFIDINIVSGKRGKGKLNKNASKKG